MADRRMRPETVAVIGLGRFGTALSHELERQGHEVLGVDTDERLVQDNVGRLTHVVVADATDPEALRQLGVGELRHAVVAIGDALEASILATANLVEMGVRDIWAKALSDQHASILERVGARHVVFPEADMGRNVAHRVTSRIIDYIQVDDTFALIETEVPAQFQGKDLIESDIRRRFDVTVVGIKPAGGKFEHAAPTRKMRKGDVLLLAGEIADVERFGAEA